MDGQGDKGEECVCVRVCVAGELLNKDPCPNTITHPHSNQNHCPRRDAVSTRTISVSMCANHAKQIHLQSQKIRRLRSLART